MSKRIGTDDAERKVIADVERFGWHCVNVLEESGDPPWSFSVGFYHSWKQPELIVVGLKREAAHAVLNIVAGTIAAGGTLDYSRSTDELLEGYSCCFVEVPTRHYYEYVGIARWFYSGNKFPLYQVVWPSKEGHFPWHHEARESFRQWQPVLGEAQVGV
jgi:hypothetical protein